MLAVAVVTGDIGFGGVAAASAPADDVTVAVGVSVLPVLLLVLMFVLLMLMLTILVVVVVVVRGLLIVALLGVVLLVVRPYSPTCSRRRRYQRRGLGCFAPALLGLLQQLARAADDAAGAVVLLIAVVGSGVAVVLAATAAFTASTPPRAHAPSGITSAPRWTGVSVLPPDDDLVVLLLLGVGAVEVRRPWQRLQRHGRRRVATSAIVVGVLVRAGVAVVVTTTPCSPCRRKSRVENFRALAVVVLVPPAPPPVLLLLGMRALHRRHGDAVEERQLRQGADRREAALWGHRDRVPRQHQRPQPLQQRQSGESVVLPLPMLLPMPRPGRRRNAVSRKVERLQQRHARERLDVEDGVDGHVQRDEVRQGQVGQAGEAVVAKIERLQGRQQSKVARVGDLVEREVQRAQAAVLPRDAAHELHRKLADGRGATPFLLLVQRGPCIVPLLLAKRLALIVGAVAGHGQSQLGEPPAQNGIAQRGASAARVTATRRRCRTLIVRELGRSVRDN